MKSILQDKKECFYCGTITGLNPHHIYAGSNRQRSDKNGFVVWLCFRCHRFLHDGAKYPIDYTMDKHLKILCQKKYEENHTREEFINLIGKNYIEEEE